MAEMKIQNLVLGMVATNCYFLKNTDTGEMILVDPAPMRQKPLNRR